MPDKFLTTTVTPGKQYVPAEAWTRAKHNLGFRPSVEVKGTVNQLNDVNATTPADGDVLAWDVGASKWNVADSVFHGSAHAEGPRKGIVPAPGAGDQDKILRGNGTWSVVPLRVPGQIYNGDFEVDDDANSVPDGWTLSYEAGGGAGVTTAQLATDDKWMGSQSWKVLTSSSKGAYLRSDAITIEPYQSYMVRWVNRRLAGTTPVVYVVAYWFKRDGTASAIKPSETVFGGATIADTWADRGGAVPVTAPWDAYNLKIELQSCMASSGTVWWDSVRLERATYNFSGLTGALGGNATLVLAHGLAATPARIEAYYECLVAEAGWVAGNRIAVGTYFYLYPGPEWHGVTIGCNATNCIWNIHGPLASWNIYIPNAAGGALGAMDKSKWAIRFFAWI